jgi:hypothetical protein
MTEFFKHPLFNIANKDTYPPFKNGLYLEEYFIKKYNEENPQLKRTYIPCKWTNFQIHPDFIQNKLNMQRDLNEFIKLNQNSNGYFTLVQYDDGPLLTLPENTIIYGACSGNISIPLIYQDINNTLESIQKSSFKEKNILCSFVGCLTHGVRNIIMDKFINNTNFYLINAGGWNPNVDQNKQNNFITTTINSKFALAPRGYGKGSFRLFEIFQLGTIPIYVWDDLCFLPYTEFLDYNKFSIILNIKNINNLEEILLNINEDQYNIMLEEYQKVKYWFTLDGMCKYIFNNEKL